MYEYLKGYIHHIDALVAIVDIEGIGYKIHIPSKTYLEPLSLKEKHLFFIAEVIREDAHTLYGFLEKEERDLFLRISSVSGIGPKTALCLISHLGINTFYEAILLGNALTLSKVPGIGKKTAERLIIEMKDKIKGKNTISIRSSNPLASDALSALINLGHDPKKAQNALQSVLTKEEELDLGSIIKQALRNL